MFRGFGELQGYAECLGSFVEYRGCFRRFQGSFGGYTKGISKGFRELQLNFLGFSGFLESLKKVSKDFRRFRKSQLVSVGFLEVLEYLLGELNIFRVFRGQLIQPRASFIET